MHSIEYRLVSLRPRFLYVLVAFLNLCEVHELRFAVEVIDNLLGSGCCHTLLDQWMRAEAQVRASITRQAARIKQRHQLLEEFAL